MKGKCHSRKTYFHLEGGFTMRPWCRGWDLNPHPAKRDSVLNTARIPFRHLGLLNLRSIKQIITGSYLCVPRPSFLYTPIMQIRLDSFLSKYGTCSRRKAKNLINDGSVMVNGEMAENVIKIDELKDIVAVNGKQININKFTFRYIMLNKPVNILSTTKDDRGRKTILDIVKVFEKIYPVGRLDYNSSGLILLTNDGDFALKISHPRYHVSKKYIVKVEENLTDAQLDRMRNGVNIYDVITSPCEINKLNDKTFEITLHQGIKRQIREMCKSVNLTVSSLQRIAIGGLELGDLKPGEFRDLTEEELIWCTREDSNLRPTA